MLKPPRYSKTLVNQAYLNITNNFKNSLNDQYEPSLRPSTFASGQSDTQHTLHSRGIFRTPFRCAYCGTRFSDIRSKQFHMVFTCINPLNNTIPFEKEITRVRSINFDGPQADTSFVPINKYTVPTKNLDTGLGDLFSNDSFKLSSSSFFDDFSQSCVDMSSHRTFQVSVF